MPSGPNPSETPFDRRLRRLRRNRAAPLWADHAFLHDRMADELAERLAMVERSFADALVLGYPGEKLLGELRGKGLSIRAIDPADRLATLMDGEVADEGRLPLEEGTFDLVLSVGLLDTINDLPGALVQIRKALKPDGLFLGACLGAGSLPILKRAMLEADLPSGKAVARVHPQIDVRAAGDLLSRAGFALQVADFETLRVRYGSFDRLIADLRGAGMTNMLGAPPLTKEGLERARAGFEAQREQGADGKITEEFAILYWTGWSPSPDQPKPAKRGSGTTSLADALKKPD